MGQKYLYYLGIIETSDLLGHHFRDIFLPKQRNGMATGGQKKQLEQEQFLTSCGLFQSYDRKFQC